MGSELHLLHCRCSSYGGPPPPAGSGGLGLAAVPPVSVVVVVVMAAAKPQVAPLRFDEHYLPLVVAVAVVFAIALPYL